MRWVGDYYDMLQVDDYLYAIIVADVSGKGTTAAFNMAQMKGVFHSLAAKDVNPKTFLAKANRALSNCLENSTFITAIYGLLNTHTRRFRYARAGHCPLAHYRHSRRSVEYLEPKGIGLGLYRSAGYERFVEEEEVELEDRDRLLFYTDGIVEARTQEGDEYGYDRLREALEILGRRKPKHMMEGLLEEVLDFVGSKAIDDDYSLLVLAFKPEEEKHES